ncbi:PAS domain S-box protein [Undibacterium seohonense]|uniref:histidine kinase n=1 Tax=Undibacterium seohonense TaxID=1344950 RepID=A0ABR6X798_9BURK|nr:ATP-binding protein [Undibacterium seohonense]MBC3808761.1 PAS domain S-box protein [Undibacterium seohonense]
MNLPSLRFLEHESPGRRLLGRLLPAIVFIGTGFATELILFEERSRQDSIARQKIISNAGEIRAMIESELNATIHLASGLVSFIKTKNGEYRVKDMEPWLTDLQSNEASIRNISIAPGNRIQTIVPSEGNESALGIYYPDNPQQWPAIEKIIRSQNAALAGPFELKQGGLGLAYRVPVFLNNGSYWGLVSTILNADQVFAQASQRAKELQLDFAIVDLEQAKHTKPIYGNLEIDRHHANQLKVNISGRDIQLLTISNKPDEFNFYTLVQRLAGWSIAFLLGFLIARTFQSYRRQTRAYFALNESQQRFMSAFNTAPQGMALVAEDGQWISANPMLCSILGYEEFELLQQPLSTLSDQLAMPLLLNQWEQRGESCLQFELGLRHRDGRKVVCLLSLALIEYEKLEKTYWIFQVIDISRRVAAESELQASAEYTQAILNNVAEGIVSTSFDGDIHSINAAALDILKFPESMLTTTNFLTRLCGDNPLSLSSEIARFIQNIRTEDFEHSETGTNILQRESVITDYHGNAIHIEFSISHVQQKSDIELIVVFRDITERKRLEMMQSEFVSIVSHELRTPLTSIIGSLKLIEGGIFGSLPDSLARMIRIALQNGEQLALIINDILDMDKLAAGKMEFHIETLSINAVISQSIENNLDFAKQYQVKFEFTKLDIDYLILADMQRVLQIMSNLLSNAAKFSSPNTIVHIVVEREPSQVRITIKDQGEGIPRQHQDRLFKKFSQVDGSSTRKKGGTGLGLSICKEMVERMDGKIGFTSVEGKGSSFHFTLPLAPSKDII